MTRPKRPRDANLSALDVVRQATAEPEQLGQCQNRRTLDTIEPGVVLLKVVMSKRSTTDEG